MSVEPGWYDAGVPGQQRWWNGTTWTELERPVPAVAPPLQPRHAPMGWFPVAGTTDVRWWDGAAWAPYRLRGGMPRPDFYAIEPGTNGVVLGCLFIVLSITQYGTYNTSGQPFFAFTPWLFMVVGVLSIIGGAQVNQLKKVPVPTTAPLFEAVTRPLPGEVHGPGAGWYPVSGQISRWWTGTQWSSYIAQKVGVRPTHAGPRTYLTSMILGWVLAGLGVAVGALGLLVFLPIDRWVSMAVVVPAGVLAVAGGLVLLLVYLRRYTMILPPPIPPVHPHPHPHPHAQPHPHPHPHAQPHPPTG